jgi:hypothetical protein
MKLSSVDPAHAFFEELCREHGIPFIDLGYDENGTLDSRCKDQDFYDFHHMNVYGSKKATVHLANEFLKLNR